MLNLSHSQVHYRVPLQRQGCGGRFRVKQAAGSESRAGRSVPSKIDRAVALPPGAESRARRPESRRLTNAGEGGSILEPLTGPQRVRTVNGGAVGHFQEDAQRSSPVKQAARNLRAFCGAPR